MNTVEEMIAKHAGEQNLRKKASSLVNEADGHLDAMATEYAAKNQVSYLDGYEHVTKVDAIGVLMLKHREEASRFIESQAGIN